MPVSVLSPIISRYEVESHCLSTISQWLETYLSETERQVGLNQGVVPRPPNPEILGPDLDFNVSEDAQSIHGGIDELTFNVGNTPEIIVLVASEGEPVVLGNGDFNQEFTVQVVAIIEDQDEDRARWVADFYGAALMGVMTQTGDLDGWASHVRMASYPHTEWVEPNDDTRLTASMATYSVWVDGVVNQYAGLNAPYSTSTGPTDSPPTQFPQISDIQLNVTAEGSVVTTAPPPVIMVIDGGNASSVPTSVYDGGNA